MTAVVVHSIGSWSEPCRPNWWLRPSLEHFEGKEERNSSGDAAAAGCGAVGGGGGGVVAATAGSRHSFSSPKASFGPSICTRWRWRQWTRSGPPLPPRPATPHTPPAPGHSHRQAPSYASTVLLTDLPAVTISGFEASHSGRNI